ncbi:MAG: tetratricopeptide repeat protein [Acidobacteriota bacterium]|nr:tetratricopeptide repeat protein [Acidobacteriota bacterium]
MALAVLASAGVCVAATVTPEGCRALTLHGRKAEAASCFEALGRSGDPYLMAEGYWGLGDYEDAKKEFEIALKMPKSSALWRARYGMLFHERFNNLDASKLFEEALQMDPENAQAYLGMAMVSADGFDGKATEYAAKAIALDPKLVEAHEFAANLLLEDAKPDEAVKEANAALALAPDALDAMATLAAADLLADKNTEADAWLRQMSAVNPGYSQGYASVAQHLVLNRRYPEGIAYYRKAVEADSKDWAARSQLGINLMRMGKEDEPRELLEDAFINGQTDAATANSLKLLDSYKNFVTTKDATTVLRMRKNEADLLGPYFSEQLHKSIETYSVKYKMKLNGPVQLEVYPDHEDFAVRTMGMPGLGALGVTFGNVVAMDSPSGRKPGDFNWGATLWHEMSHVFVLSATGFRVPRWFTEGLAVHEEGQVDPRWANRLTPDVVVAIKEKKLLPVAEMDQGFIFPKYPDQVLVSYWQAGTILDYISEKWGNDAVLGMVKSFAALKTTPETIQDNLHVSPKEFDKQYEAWLDKRVGTTVANFDKWRTDLKSLVGMSEKKDGDGVIAAAAAMVKLYPEYVEDANAYEILANAQLAKGNKQAAVDALKLYELMGGENPATLKKLASLEEDLGRSKDAAETLDLLNFIYPEDEEMHRKLGGLWLAQGNNAGAVREFSAVLAMKPLDMATAEFDVARAYLAAGDKGKAEESVLASLEAAPGFRPAQKLLLEIEGK